MKKIIGYFHICQKGDWKKSFDMIFNYVKNYGLYDATSEIRLGIVSDDGNIIEDYRLHNSKFKRIFEGNSSLYERPTLLHMRNSCDSDGHDTVYWYLHTKGLRHFGTPKESYVIDWIKLMLYWNIQKWRNALDVLNSHNTYGINILGMVFYSGNFWWARAEHVSHLPTQIEDYYTAPEDWILRKKDGVFEAFSSGIQGEGHYNMNYPEQNYKQGDDLNKILPIDFYIDTYKLYHFDQNKKSNEQYIDDYFVNGIQSGIRYNREVIVDVFINKLPSNFNFEFHKNSNPNLKNYSVEEIIVHCFTNGILVGNNNNIDIPPNFDYNFYRNNYKDLKDFNDIDLVNHWNLHGKKEGRKFNLYSDFDYNFYKTNYPDLKKLSDKDLLKHWIEHGEKEGRIYKSLKIPKDFNYLFYKKKYDDLSHLSDKELISHWFSFGQKEGRTYK